MVKRSWEEVEDKILSLLVLLTMTVQIFFHWGIRVLHLEETGSGTIQRSAISIPNGRKFNIMVKNLTIMEEKEKDQVHMNIITILYLNQLQGDN
jgi:hypothetical protein